jgi:hypothetical protein
MNDALLVVIDAQRAFVDPDALRSHRHEAEGQKLCDCITPLFSHYLSRLP